MRCDRVVLCQSQGSVHSAASVGRYVELSLMKHQLRRFVRHANVGRLFMMKRENPLGLIKFLRMSNEGFTFDRRKTLKAHTTNCLTYSLLIYIEHMKNFCL